MRPNGWPVEWLAPAVESLSLDQRRVLWLRFGQGLGVASIAAVLGVDEQSVELLQLRGLQQVRRAWQAGSGVAGGSARAREPDTDPRRGSA
jgi:DNA-directed RNA polymerase specialized sigma24 family protein